ncbi:MAG: AAA family ATPase [Deltaproteobacteria bacterium]|nr:AAA family ATPase [Myxococcales bacterium]MDP3217592.1 AAA family ATPase [Deltaproteobacteria bacterium]
MLKWLKVHRFRHVKPGTELAFNERFNVLLGRNGTGKTTLLDLISMVVRSDFSGLREEEFDLEFELQHEEGTIRVGVANALAADDGANSSGARVREGRRPSPEYSAHLFATLTLLHLDPPESFEIEVEHSTRRWRSGTGGWRTGGPTDIFRPGVFSALTRGLNYARRGEREAMEVLIDSYLQGRSAFRFDESLGAYDSIIRAAHRDHDRPAEDSRVRAEVHFKSVRDGVETSKIASSNFMPMVDGIAEPEHGQTSATVSLDASRLRKFPDAVGLREITMSVSVEGSYSDELGLWWQFSGLDFLFTEPGGSSFSHHALSYGQKRLLAFLYYLDANHRYVIADELVNGMHHDWIRFCLDEMSGLDLAAQAFLTSQNPLLLDYIPIGSAEEAQRSFIQCRSEVIDGHSRFVWSNLSADDARELFADHQVGIQHLGELLRVRGLW